MGLAIGLYLLGTSLLLGLFAITPADKLPATIVKHPASGVVLVIVLWPLLYLLFMLACLWYSAVAFCEPWGDRRKAEAERRVGVISGRAGPAYTLVSEPAPGIKVYRFDRQP